MVMVFFITSADSGALVLNMLSSNGRDDTPMARRIFWMAMIGVSALVLLLAGGLSALQTAAIASALPFSLAILAAIWGFVRALSVDHAKRQTLHLTSVAPTGGPRSTDWRERLRNVLHYPERTQVETFLRNTAHGALEQFAEELRNNGLEARVTIDDAGQQVGMSVMHGDEIDFQYWVVARHHATPTEALGGEDGEGDSGYYRAEVHLNEGSQDYDVMGWTQEQVVHDLLEQYEKHLHFLHVLR